MSDTEANRAVITSAFAAIAAGNGRPFIDMMSPDIAWRIIGATAWSKTYKGKGEVLALLKALRDQFVDGKNNIQAHRILADGDCVVVEAGGDNTTVTGKRYANEYCWVFRFERGQVVEMVEYADTQLMIEALVAP